MNSLIKIRHIIAVLLVNFFGFLTLVDNGMFGILTFFLLIINFILGFLVCIIVDEFKKFAMPDVVYGSNTDIFNAKVFWSFGIYIVALALLFAAFFIWFT